MHFVLNGAELGSSVVRLGSVSGLISEAEEGTTGMSTIPLDDAAGSLSVTGWQTFIVNEDAGPAGQRRLFTGYVGARHYGRAVGTSLITGASRRIGCDLVDINAILSFRLFPPSDTAANRPSETDVARLQWLLSTSYLVPTVTDYGFVNTSGGITLDAADYRGQSPMSLVSDCANASGKNYFLYYDETNGGVGIWYDFDYSTNFTCPLRLSNVLSDVGTNPSGTNYEAAVLATTPVSYWRLDELSGTIAADVMGVNPGTYVTSFVAAAPVSVAGLLTGDPDTAISFPLTNSTRAVILGAGIDLTATDFTMLAWVNPATVTGRQTIFGSDSGGYELNLFSSGLLLRCANVADSVVDGTSFSIGVPVMVGVTYKNSTGAVQFYVNGQATLSIAGFLPAFTPGAHTSYLGVDPSIGAWLSGVIDEPAIWNRALSPTEIAALYAAGTTAPTTFAYEHDAELTVDPNRVYSGVQVPFSGTGSPQYVTDAATATTFGVARDTTAPNVNAKTAVAASALGSRYLLSIATEDRSLTLTVRLPAATAPLVRAGMRIGVKGSHLPGLTSFTYLRILHTEYKQDEASDQFYNVVMVLSPPVLPTAAFCSNGPTPSGTFAANLSGTSAGTGNVIYLKPGLTYPTVPTPGFAGAWNFPTYNSGGVDYAGDCVGNTFRAIVAGNGTITIPTIFSTIAHTWHAYVYHIDPATSVQVEDAAISGAVGTPVVYTITGWSQAGGPCYHWVDVTDTAPNPCGSNFAGFSGFTWALT